MQCTCFNKKGSMKTKKNCLWGVQRLRKKSIPKQHLYTKKVLYFKALFIHSKSLVLFVST